MYVFIILYFLFSKVVEQKMVLMPTSHVFFHLFTMENHITSVLQTIMINHGALLRLMLVDTILMEIGETVTATVLVVILVSFCFTEP